MDNEQYDAVIVELIQLITSAKVSQMGKAEFFGYTLDHVIRHYVHIAEGRSDRFNADLFPPGVRNSLDVVAHRLAALVGPEDPLEAAKDLHYVILRLLQAVFSLPNMSLGVFSQPNVSPGVSYFLGMSLFLKGSIQKTMYEIQTALDVPFSADPQERVIVSRRRVVALGVLSDALGHCGET